MTDNIKLPPFPEGMCLREDIEDYAREAVLRDRAYRPQRDVVPLSDGWILGMWPDTGMPDKVIEFARKIEACHGIGAKP